MWRAMKMAAVPSLVCLAACATPARYYAPPHAGGPAPARIQVVQPRGVGAQMHADTSRQTLAMLNQYRARRGLKPLRLDAQMTGVAYEQAVAMATRDYMDHNIIGDFGARLRAHNVLNVSAGENIGRNIRSAERMFAWWANSPVHERNMSNPRVTRLGFAVVRSEKTGKPYWAMALASD